MKTQYKVSKSEAVLDTHIQALVFDKETFATKNAVEAYLADNGFEDTEIFEEETRFIAKAAGEAVELSSLLPIAAETGVTVMVGKDAEADIEDIAEGVEKIDDADAEADSGAAEEAGEAGAAEEAVEEDETEEVGAAEVRRKTPQVKPQLVIKGVSSRSLALKLDYLGASDEAELVANIDSVVPLDTVTRVFVEAARKAAKADNSALILRALREEYDTVVKGLFVLAGRGSEFTETNPELAGKMQALLEEQNVEPPAQSPDVGTIVKMVKAEMQEEMDSLRDKISSYEAERKRKSAETPKGARRSGEVDDCVPSGESGSTLYKGMTEEERTRAQKIDDRLFANLLGQRQLTSEDDSVYYRQ